MSFDDSAKEIDLSKWIKGEDGNLRRLSDEDEYKAEDLNQSHDLLIELMRAINRREVMFSNQTRVTNA